MINVNNTNLISPLLYLRILRTLKRRSIKVKAYRRFSFPGNQHIVCMTFNKKSKGVNYVRELKFTAKKDYIEIELGDCWKWHNFPMDSMHDQMKFYDLINSLLEGKEIGMIKWVDYLWLKPQTDF